MTPYDPAFQQRIHQAQTALATHGNSVTATQQAYGSVYGTLLKQSMLLSYIDDFRLLGFLCLLCVPAALLFKKVRASKGPVAVH